MTTTTKTRRKTPPAKPTATKTTCRSCGKEIGEAQSGLCYYCDPAQGARINEERWGSSSTAPAETPLSAKERTCRVCGCTHYDPCCHASGDTCNWVEADLCSACQEIAADPSQAEDWEQPTSEVRRDMPRDVPEEQTPHAAKNGRTKLDRLRDAVATFGAATEALRRGNGHVGKPSAPTGTPAIVPINSIRESADNARRNYSGLAELAKSIAADGLLQPIVVRPLPPATIPMTQTAEYEVIAGARRLRACRLACLEEVPVLVRDVSAQEAMVLRATENLQRQDLNELEKAAEWQRLCRPVAEGGAGLQQKELAARLGLDPSTISNTIRLLELPESIRPQLVSREISPTHARYLLPYKDAPAVMAAVEEKIRDGGGIGSLRDFEKTLRQIVTRCSAGLVQGVYANTAKGYVHSELRISADHPQYAELQIIEVDTWNGRKEKRALNTQLAKQILGEKARAWRAKHPPRDATKQARGQEPTTAELKQRAEAEREQRRRALTAWYDRWRMVLCAAAIATGELPTKLLALLTTDLVEYRLIERIAAAVPWNQRSIWSMQDGDVVCALHQSIAEALRSTSIECEYADQCLERGDLDGLAQLLKIDPVKAWAQRGPHSDQAFAGELTESFFDLFDVQGLLDLAGEWKLSVPAAKSKRREDLIEVLTTCKQRILPLPHCLQELVKAKPANKRKEK